MRLTDRDVKLIRKCAICRWLTTTQVQRLYFPRGSINAVQKRLRKLAEAGFVSSWRANLTAETLHAVGPKGKPLLDGLNIDVVLGGVPKQWEHLTGINDLRLAIV